MKKNFLMLILLLVGLFLIIPSQIEATPVDMVIMLDTSASVFPIYNDLLNYIIRDIISDHLKFGDTLHLLTFDATPSFILSRQINTIDDIEFVINNLFLLHPFGRHTDVISAFKYLRDYISRVPSYDQSREIVILTDGIHNPPPGSPYQLVIDPVTGANLLQIEVEELRKTDWKITIIRLPDDPSAEAPRISGTIGVTGQQDAVVANGFVEPSIFDFIDNARVFTPDANNVPTEERRSLPATAVETPAAEIPGTEADRAETSARSSILDSFAAQNNAFILFILLIILFTIIVFILIIRYFSGASVRESYKIVRSDIDKDGCKSDDGNRRPIIMKVAGQNDLIVGTSRNIHGFKRGTVKSIGGSNSSYLIFLYKMPGAIASLKFDGDKYIFTPIKSEFFPTIGDREIENPLDQDITIMTEKQQTVSIRFWEYISPLERINAILKLTERRGLPPQFTR